MSENHSKSSPLLIWSKSQIAALTGLLILLAMVCAVRLALNRAFIDDPQPAVSARANDLADQLDPNAATWQEMAAIPGLGESKAHAIVAFREKWSKAHGGHPAFSGPQDLRNVKGIGPATVSNLTPYLFFPRPMTEQNRP